MGGGKGGGGGPLPDYEQIIKDQAYYNRMGQLGPTESLVWNGDRSMGARVLSPAQQLQQELSMGLSSTAMGTLLGWYGGTPAQFGQFDPNTGTYGMGAGGGGGGAGAVPNWEGLDPAQKRAMIQAGYADENGMFRGGDGRGGATGSSGATGFHDPYGDGGGQSAGGLPGIVGGPYEGLGFGDQDLLREIMDAVNVGDLMGGGGGGGSGGWSSGGGGGGVQYGDLTDMITFDENGNPTIGPGFADALNFGGFDQYLPGEGDLMGARQGATDAAYEAIMSRVREEDRLRGAQDREMLANRGVGETGAIGNEFAYQRDIGFNDAVKQAIAQSFGEGRAEHSMLWGQGMERGQSELQRAIQDAMLQNQKQQGMIDANFMARGQEASEDQADAALRAQYAAQGQNNWLAQQGMDMQRLQMALQAQNALYGQQMGERGLLANELFTLSGFGAPAGMGGYWQPGMVDANGASNAAMNNAMYNFQSDPLTMLLSAGTQLGSAFLGAGGAASSVNYKKDFEEIDGEEVLEKVERLVIPSWRYKGEENEAPKRIGPMAEQFHEEFGTPDTAGDTTVIDLISANGVALKAIQELTKRVKELEARLGE